MAQAKLLFHGHLQSLLPAAKRGKALAYSTQRRASVKDVIEALGPPHTEVGHLALDGKPVDFNTQLASGQTLEIFPVPVPWDVTRTTLLRLDPLPRLAFLVDENVHRLAKLLRMIGQDATDCRGLSDAAIAVRAGEEKRVLLSRDRRLLKRGSVDFGRLVQAHHPWDQLREIMHLFGLWPRVRPFSRCIHCNQPLEPRAKSDIEDRLEPLTRRYFQIFHECPECRRIYWAGSHHQQMLEHLRKLKDSVP